MNLCSDIWTNAEIKIVENCNGLNPAKGFLPPIDKALPPLIKYVGSKRMFFQRNWKLLPICERYVDAFVGGGSFLPYASSSDTYAGDMNGDLISLYKLLQDHNGREYIKKTYRELWEQLQEKEKIFYYEVRDKFNISRDPAYFLFLTRTSHNGMIRYNKKNNFNAGFHVGRPGIHPDKLDRIIEMWCPYLHKVNFLHQDYKETLKLCDDKTFSFLDPPYFGNVSDIYIHGSSQFDFPTFFDELRRLNKIGTKWILTLNGVQENVVPKDLYCYVLNREQTSFLRQTAKKDNVKEVFSDYFNYTPNVFKND